MENSTNSKNNYLSTTFKVLSARKHKVLPYNLDWKDNDDINILRKRICADLTDKDLDVTEILDDIADDGSFKSIDYLSEDKKTWHAIKHLENLKKIQIAIHSEGNKNYDSKDAKGKVLKCVNYWVDKNYICPWSGWYNTIGIGLYIPDILLFGVDGFEDEKKAKLLANFKPTLIQNETVKSRVIERNVDATAANLFDEIMASMKVAIVENDGNTLMWLKEVVENELRVFPPHIWPMHRYDSEGIREDMSFQQHFQLVYFGGYGDVFLNGAARYLKYTIGTQYEINNTCANLFADFILDGIQFPMRNGYRDFNSAGRGCARKGGATGIKTSLKNSVDALLQYSSIKRHNELQDLVKNRYEAENDKGAGGHRYFYESDYQVMNDAKYMATVRHASNKTRIFEFLNDENALGFYTGLGGTFFYVDGNEYENTPPVFDWNQVPGTTTRQGFMPKKSWIKSYNEVGNTNLVGGVSNGKFGASYFHLKQNGVFANKAYFMFSDGVVCLGSNVSCSKNNEIVTDINQANLQDNVYIGNDKLQLNNSFNDVCPFVYHNKIAYITDNKVNVSAKKVSGDWARVYLKLKDDKYDANMFNISINHGIKPHNDSYAYTVLMNVTLEDAKNYAKNPYYEILANNKTVQAVWDNKNNIIMAIFHKSGSINVDNKVLDVNKPCCLMVENGTIATVASHNYKDSNVVIKFNGIEKQITVCKKPTKFIF